jgi:hypothetical protein
MTDKRQDSPHHRADVEVSQDGDKVTLKAPAAVTLNADEAKELAGRLFEASALARGEDPEENDWLPAPMHYLVVAAERMEFTIGDGDEPVAPNPDPEMGNAKNAEVHCWIKDQTLRNAMHIAAGSIAEHGWVMSEVLDQRRVTRADFTDTEYLQYYEQALTDSEVFLYELEDTEGEETEGTADAS